MQRTLVIIKPDATAKNIIGKIIAFYEELGLEVTALKLDVLDGERLKQHYYEHINKPFYKSLVDFMSSGISVLMIVSGEDAVVKVREINGATNPEEAVDGTIRKIYGESIQRNAVHGSANAEDAVREIEIWF
jgi:nucleoside-diphosphate kinase